MQHSTFREKRLQAKKAQREARHNRFRMIIGGIIASADVALVLGAWVA